MVTRRDAAREIVGLLPAVALNLRLAALFDLESVELTANQMLALLLIGSAPEGRLRSGDVAARLQISLPATSALVDRLVAAGVVARSQGDDRRVVWVGATEAGRGLLTRMAEGLEQRVDAAMEIYYDAATIDALVEGMRRVASFADLVGEAHGPASVAPRRPGDAPGGLPP